jgi:hypothetical protein
MRDRKLLLSSKNNKNLFFVSFIRLKVFVVDIYKFVVEPKTQSVLFDQKNTHAIN